MKFPAIIFDLDGTLLDTLKDLADSMNRILNSKGFPAHPVDSYKFFVGDGIEKLVRRTLPDNERKEETIRECIGLMRDDYSRNWNISTQPYPGIETMLNRLKKTGLRMSILSNKPDDFTQLTVSYFLSKWNFEVIMGIKDGMPKKPDPRLVFEISKKMSLDPADFLYVGDTATDMKTAISSGAYPAGVLWGFRDKEELLKSGAKAILEKPDDIFKIL